MFFHFSNTLHTSCFSAFYSKHIFLTLYRYITCNNAAVKAFQYIFTKLFQVYFSDKNFSNVMTFFEISPNYLCFLYNLVTAFLTRLRVATFKMIFIYLWFQQNSVWARLKRNGKINTESKQKIWQFQEFSRKYNV